MPPTLFALIKGMPHAFRLAELQEVILESGQDLDSHLTRRFTSGFATKHSKKRLLVWYWTMGAQGVLFFVTRLGTPLRFDWLREIPGFSWAREIPIPFRARLIFYWSGANLYRTCAAPASINPPED